MTFSIYVEHTLVGGNVVLEEFEGVKSFNSPPPTNKLHIKFADDRDDVKLDYGVVVRGDEESNND